MILLDGPMGTELLARGIATPLPGWSAHALATAPAIVRKVHADYLEAGADVLTTNTFRTQRRYFPDRWRELLATAVAATREHGGSYRVAGSIAPLEDCYAPERSPANPGPEHREVARALAEESVDLLLVETFPHVGEALIACEQALATGLETWVSFTAGPDANLLTPDEVGAGAERAVALGVSAVLVNCLPTRRVTDYLPALQGLGVPFGAYGNAGEAQDEVGFTTRPIDPADYAAIAAEWRTAGATIVGSCCGTGVAHTAALAASSAN